MSNKLDQATTKFKEYFVECLNALDNFNFSEIKNFYEVNLERIKNSQRLPKIAEQLTKPYINFDQCNNVADFKKQLLDIINEFHEKFNNQYTLFTYSSIIMNYFCVVDLAYSKYHFGTNQIINDERKFFLELRNKIYNWLSE
ncbi:hypothetical protein [Mycoplasma bradburyae]|uniref:hypothetical protein n=1 Tax=Mycoplasma bradburyae TaxID=2963128 RepID=UPI0020CDE312|nr:hypothetical protein [Mycoplasma bradburyae]UTS70512.1 hypothetical protein NMG77_02040 [Mycoplasma bradburyae]